MVERLEPWTNGRGTPRRCGSGRCGSCRTRRTSMARSGRPFDRSRRRWVHRQTLRRWVRQAERDEGRRPGLTNEDQQRVKVLERENRELRRTNEILRKASAYFAQAELDRRGP